MYSMLITNEIDTNGIINQWSPQLEYLWYYKCLAIFELHKVLCWLAIIIKNKLKAETILILRTNYKFLADTEGPDKTDTE